jgi:hypothetical protein
MPGYAAKQKVCDLGQSHPEAHGTEISHEKSTNDISNIVNVIYDLILALSF